MVENQPRASTSTDVSADLQAGGSVSFSVPNLQDPNVGNQILTQDFEKRFLLSMFYADAD